MDEEKLERRLKVAVGVMLLAIACMTGLTLGSAIERGSAADEVRVSTSGMAPGMPLDAIQYQSPTWMPDAKQVFEVVDRTNGSSWWVLKTNDDQWVALPIERSAS